MSDAQDDSNAGSKGGMIRRDFIGSTLVGAGAALLTAAAPGAVARAQAGAKPRNQGMTELGAEWTGPGGVGDYAKCNGNTADIVNRAHGYIRNGELDAKIAQAADTKELYDLVVVGAGIAGLSAAYDFRKKKPDGRVLIIEMADMFGGEAKGNEFEVDGYTLTGPQGSNAVGGYVLGGAFHAFHPIYSELGLPSEYTHEFPKNLKKDILFPTDNWLAMAPGYKGADIGHFFEGHGWVKNPYETGWEGAPISDALKINLMKAVTDWRVPYREDWQKYIDSVSYKQWLMDNIGLTEEAVDMVYGEYTGVEGGGLGPDVASAAVHVDGLYAHRESLSSGKVEGRAIGDVLRGVELPGGNGTLAKRMAHRLIPELYADAEAFDKFLAAKINRAALDVAGKPVRMRLNSTVMSVKHDGDAKRAKSVSVVYSDADGKLHRVTGRNVIMCGQQHANKHIIHDLPKAHRAAMDKFMHGPILVVNVAVRHWRFMADLGISCARWYNGFGWWTTVHPQISVNGKPLEPFDPDKPTVMTLYIPFLANKGLPLAEQAVAARMEMFALQFSDIEQGVRDQFTKMFGEHGFNADRDIAGIVANRQGHAYVVPYPGFVYGKDGEPGPSEILRKGHGRIGFAHAELAGVQFWSGATAEAIRAVDDVLKRG